MEDPTNKPTFWTPEELSFLSKEEAKERFKQYKEYLKTGMNKDLKRIGHMINALNEFRRENS